MSFAAAPYSFTIPADHPCLAGHFPGQPIVPGVLVLEQVLRALDTAGGPSLAWRMPQVKFLQPLLPQQQASIELEPILVATADGTTTPTRWRFRVTRDGEAIASGEVCAE